MKTAIITGANGNLGAACVKKFLEDGHRVIAVDGHSDHLSFAKDNPAFEFVSVNLTDETSAAAFVKQMIEKYQKVDAALMLVGGFMAGDIHHTGGKDIDNMISLNFKTAYFIAKPLLPHLQSNGYGRLIFVGARPALVPAQGKNLLAYALSKSLLFTLAEQINESCKGTNITASVVAPSTIDTPLNRSQMPEADPTAWVTPASIAASMAFLVSENGNALRETVLKLYNNS